MLADPEVLPAEAMTDIMRTLVAGVRLAVTDPQHALKDLWNVGAAMPPSLFPPELPEPPR